jgi:2-keto-4-pentenoate hydratase/2-oxohepta-3-ene-1,7-dioic acid hydratase in catechol pathway
VGEWIPWDSLADKRNIRFQFRKNGEVVQDGESANMIFGIDEIIAHVSEYFTLNIGDLIFTGTPAGVGEVVITDLLEAFLEGRKLLEVEVR